MNLFTEVIKDHRVILNEELLNRIERLRRESYFYLIRCLEGAQPEFINLLWPNS